MKKWKSWNCHDCGVQEGQLHKSGCDMERCPKCGTQLITCDCTDEEIANLPRIPYLLNPNLCVLCGEQWPELFSVPDEEWKRFVIPSLQAKVLCRECYQEMQAIFPNGWKQPKEVRESIK